MVYQKNSSKARKSTPIKKKLFLQSLEKHLGVISPALKEVDINRATYLRWQKSDPKFKEEIDNINSSAIDFVESKLYENINKGNVVAQIFYLKCKGGEVWKEKQQIDQTISYNQPLRLEIIPPHQLPQHNENLIIDISPEKKKLNE